MSVFANPTDATVDPQTAVTWIAAASEVQVIDVRERYEFEAGHIAGVRHIELERLAGMAEQISRERPVLFCRLRGWRGNGNTRLPRRRLRRPQLGRRDHRLAAAPTAASSH